MGQQVEMVGVRFGRLVAISEAGKGSNGFKYLFKCDCGNEKIISGPIVRSGKASSCGCLRSERTAKKNLTHGKVDTPEYQSWQAMKNRCLNPNQSAYKNYGGRGITICDKWIEFAGFAEDMGERPEGCSLERIDNSKGYSKDNCVWATIKSQNRNTRQNKYLTYNGVTLCMKDWSIKTGIPYPTIQDRVRRGWETDKVLSKGSR